MTSDIDPIAALFRSEQIPTAEQFRIAVVTQCKALRSQSLVLEQKLRTLKTHVASHYSTLSKELAGEAIAHATLAFREQELVRFHLGKTIQAYEGGVSIYDKHPELIGQHEAPGDPDNSGTKLEQIEAPKLSKEQWIEEVHQILRKTEIDPITQTEDRNLREWAEAIANCDNHYYDEGMTPQEAVDEELSGS